MQIQCLPIAIAAIGCGVIILAVMLKSKRFFKSAALSAAEGLCAMLAVNLLSGITGVYLAVNPITAAVCALGGSSGVIALLLTRLIVL